MDCSHIPLSSVFKVRNKVSDTVTTSSHVMSQAYTSFLNFLTRVSKDAV